MDDQRAEAVARAFYKANGLRFDPTTYWFDPVLEAANAPDNTIPERIREPPKIEVQDKGRRNFVAQKVGIVVPIFSLPHLTGAWSGNLSPEVLAQIRGTCDVSGWQLMRDAATDFPPYRRPHPEIREILLSMAQYSRVTNPTWKRLRRLVGNVQLTGTTALAASVGEFATAGRAEVGRIDQLYGLLIARLINAGFGDRVRKCDLAECNNLFVAWSRRGKERKWCTSAHGERVRGRRKRRAAKQRGMMI